VTENSRQNIAILDKANKSYVHKIGSDLQADINGTKSALGEVSVKLDQGLDEKLSIHGGNSMTVDLDMGNNKIINLSTDSHNVLSATIVMYINQSGYDYNAD